MTNEYVIYRGMPTSTSNKSNLEKSLEVMKWILDPSSRPYDIVDKNNNNRMTVRSAGVSSSTIETEKPQQRRLISIQQMLEIRDKVIQS